MRKMVESNQKQENEKPLRSESQRRYISFEDTFNKTFYKKEKEVTQSKQLQVTNQQIGQKGSSSMMDRHSTGGKSTQRRSTPRVDASNKHSSG